MSLKFRVLGSGSSGNCIYIASRATAILVDAGLSGKETLRRLEQSGIELSTVCGICLTHEHGDHINGLSALRKRLRVDVYANAGTIEAIGGKEAWRVFTNGFPFLAGDIRVEPFSVCHDASDPVGFVMSVGDVSVGIVTDIGTPTALVRERLKNCAAVVLEANHDTGMLRDAARPWSLKQRIAGRHGHLSNQDAAGLVADVAGPRLKHVFLAHLSADCNTPAAAVAAVRKALAGIGREDVAVSPTFPDRTSDEWEWPG